MLIYKILAGITAFIATDFLLGENKKAPEEKPREKTGENEPPTKNAPLRDSEAHLGETEQAIENQEDITENEEK